MLIGASADAGNVMQLKTLTAICELNKRNSRIAGGCPILDAQLAK